MHTYARFAALLVLSVPLALVAGCGLLPQRDNTPVHQYRIAPDVATDTAPAPTCELVVRVSNFAVSPPWTSNDMLYTQTEHAIEAYAYNRWAAAPATMLGDALVRALGASDLYRGVLGPTSPGSPDLTLALTLDRGPLQIFPPQATGQKSEPSSSREVLALTANLTATGNGELIASRSFSDTQSAAPNAYGGVVAANALAGRLIGQMLGWLAQTNATTEGCASQ